MRTCHASKARYRAPESRQLAASLALPGRLRTAMPEDLADPRLKRTSDAQARSRSPRLGSACRSRPGAEEGRAQDGSDQEGRDPKNVFFKGQTASQYLAKDRLLGAKVVNKSGEAVGTIDDLIVNQGGQIEGVVMGVGGVLGVGAKQIGVRLSALKISTADGKFTITLPDATKEMLGAVGAYQRATPAKK